MSMDRLKSLYYGLYGENGITNFFYDQLVSIMETAKANRSPQLKRQDKKGNSWYLLLMVLYCFSGNLSTV